MAKAHTASYLHATILQMAGDFGYVCLGRAGFRQPVTGTLQLHLLGEFRLVYDHTPVITLNTPRLQALLAYLALHRHAP